MVRPYKLRVLASAGGHPQACAGVAFGLEDERDPDLPALLDGADAEEPVRGPQDVGAMPGRLHERSMEALQRVPDADVLGNGDPARDAASQSADRGVYELVLTDHLSRVVLGRPRELRIQA